MSVSASSPWAPRTLLMEATMRSYCWSVVFATIVSLGVFGCAVSNDMARDDDSESAASVMPAESAVTEALATESEAGTTCQLWTCVFIHPQNPLCDGIAQAPQLGTCNTLARNDCNEHCGFGCVRQSNRCEF